MARRSYLVLLVIAVLYGHRTAKAFSIPTLSNFKAQGQGLRRLGGGGGLRRAHLAGSKGIQAANMVFADVTGPGVSYKVAKVRVNSFELFVECSVWLVETRLMPSLHGRKNVYLQSQSTGEVSQKKIMKIRRYL